MSTSLKTPFSVFRTDQVAPRDQFDAWRQSIGVAFEVEPSEKLATSGFAAEVRTYNLGDMLVSAAKFGAEHFKRDARRISRDGLDHYLVQLYWAGGLTGSTRHRPMNVRPGDIQIVDLSQPHESLAANSASIAITVGRDLIAEMVSPRIDLHGVVLRGDRGTGALLSDHMKSLLRRLASLDAAEAPFAARTTAHMIAACATATVSSQQDRSPTNVIVVDRLKRYIEENLASRDLSPRFLSERFRISRTQLYRIFEPLGGVAGYIQTRRLDRAFGLLRNPFSRNRPVSDVAYTAGFSNLAHFATSFRRAFGLSPSDLRAVSNAPNLRPYGALSHPVGGYEDWVRGLRRHQA
jgi:AraC-like DNA-binding protein